MKMKKRSIRLGALLIAFLTPVLYLFPGTFGTSPVFDAESFREYDVKAAWLKRFTLFVDWPDDGNNNSTKPFVIGVIGNTPLLKQMEIIYSQNKLKIKERDVKIRTISDREEIPGCNMVFISRSAKPRLSSILSYLKNKPVLTVSDTEGFGIKGVHINFYTSDNNLKFEVNKTSIQSAGLTISFHLFSAAGKIIESAKERK